MPKRIEYKKGQQLGNCIFLRDVTKEYIGVSKKGRFAAFLCVCGNEFIASTENVLRKKHATISCGCIRRKRLADGTANKTHGKSKTDEYKIWGGIVKRCYDANSYSYEYYGGRGIKMSDEWRNDFTIFLKDIGLRPSKKHSVERLNVNGDYCKENCVWATQKQQGRNKRNNHLITFNGETKCVSEWVELLHITKDAVKRRASNGGDLTRDLRGIKYSKS